MEEPEEEEEGLDHLVPDPLTSSALSVTAHMSLTVVANQQLKDALSVHAVSTRDPDCKGWR